VTYQSRGIFNKTIKDAVKGVSFNLKKGQTLGVVGESGSGKSTLARAILRLEPSSGGSIIYDKADITNISGRPLRDLRKSVQVVLQDPYSALNPRLTVGAAIAEGLIIQGICKQEATQRAYELLSLTDLTENAFDRYPQEFSGGQRQRICIARALVLNPELLIADEAVSALDVSIQDKILQLLADLQKKLNFAMIFITHDLRVARVICDEVIVMKSGKVVESGRASEVLERPVHSYTRALVKAALHLPETAVRVLA
jgi:peptide/nickel transport system ATP-binding protein